MQNIFIYGIGDFARLMLHYFTTDSSYQVVGFCADQKYITCDKFCELPVVPLEEIDLIYPFDKYQVFIAIGYSSMRVRGVMYDKIKAKKYKCINYISSKAIIDKSLTMGENNVILENTVIEPFVKLGNNNIIWSSCNICHNVKIQSHCFIAAQSLVGGFSNVKDNCFLGFNSAVFQNIILEKETLVGAKSLILKNTEEYGKYLGSPAKHVGTNKEHGIKIK